MEFSDKNISPASKRFQGPRSEEKKQCFPVYSLIQALGNPVVDYFSLDVEGSELDILGAILQIRFYYDFLCCYFCDLRPLMKFNIESNNYDLIFSFFVFKK